MKILTHANKIFSLIGCLLLAGIFALADASRAADPRQCPADIAQAIEAGDTAAFERLVDVDAILNEALTLFLAEMRKPEVANQLPPVLALMFAQAGSGGEGGANIRNLLFTETRAFVLNGVSSGAFAGRTPTGQDARGILAPLFAGASTGRKEIRRIGHADPDGGDWLVPFVVHDGGNDRDYPVVGRISPVAGSFRLTRVENLEELFARVSEESRAAN